MGEIIAQEQNALSVIQNMVTSGNFDVSVARELLEMQKDFMKQQAIINFNNDFSLMSKEIPVIAKTKKAHNTWYAPLEDIVKITQPILSKYGFSISFSTSQNGLDSVTVQCTLMHRDGHSTSTELMLPTKSVSNSMNAMQAIGAAITYAKRYTLSGILNIATGDDDNNGFTTNAKTSKPRMSPDQLEKALAAIKEEKYTLEKLFSTYELTSEQLVEVVKNGK
ncbi:MAG: ERF family protein [Acinetobacter sp.]